MKKYAVIIFLFAVSLPNQAHAGKLFEKVKNRIKDTSKKVSIGSKAKSALKTGLGFVPGGSLASNIVDNFTGETDSEKIDGIFDGVVEISDDLMQLKRMTENVYFQELRARRRAADLVAGIKKADVRKLFGAAIEGTLNIPINPADYVPNLNESTSKLRKNIDFHMDHERKLVRENGFSLTGTIRSLLKTNPDLWKTDPKRFEEELKEAEKFEEELDESLRAQNMSMLKTLSAEKARLQEENKKLAENLKKPGTKPTEIIQTQQAINGNNQKVLDAENRIREMLDEMRKLHEKDKLILAKYEAMKNRTALNGFLRKRRREIKEDYKHLSLLNF